MAREKEYGFLGRVLKTHWANQEPPRFVFQADQAVAYVEAIKVSVLGRQYLRVPANTVAVLCKLDGTVQTFPAGLHLLHLPTGRYELYFADATERTTRLDTIQGLSQDTLDVYMDVRLCWKIINPEMVVSTQNPFPRFIEACEGLIEAFIAINLHDDLVPQLGNSRFNIPELNDKLRKYIEGQRQPDGILLTQVLIQKVRPDRGKQKAIQDASRLIAEIEQARLVQAAETEKERDALQQELGLSDLRRTLAVTNANIKRREQEERELIRLTIAQLRNEAELLQLPSRQQEIYLERLRTLPQYQQEQLLKIMDILAAQLSRPGIQPNLSNEGLEMIFGMMNGLADDLRGSPRQIRSPEEDRQQIIDEPLAIRLFQELKDALTLPKVSEGQIVMNVDGSISSIIKMAGFEITVECDESYPKKGPRRIRVQQGTKPFGEFSDLIWNERSVLRDVVVQTQQRISTGSLGNPPGGDGRSGD